MGALTLSESDLEFARKHIKSFYASDFFPDPDEYGAVWSGWDDVMAFYKTAKVADLGTTPEDMACAKAIGGYRIVHQLQPLDTLTYTALAGIVAPHLELSRIPKQEGIACSYRLAPDASGRFFESDSDAYSVYRTRSYDLAQSHSWVFVADISSFYNHIYIHRVEGAIQNLDRSLGALARDMHEFLLNLNDRVSIGIPVGPAASIVVAELVLNDVDQFLRAHHRRPTYTRYVDDFRFFSNSRSELEELWHDMASYLHRSQRLSLANGKCKILASQQFLDDVMQQTLAVDRSELARAVGISFEEVVNSYAQSNATSSVSIDTTQRREALDTLFGQLLLEPELNIGLARQILRRARSLRLRCIARPLFRNLEKLAPVIRDAGLYLNAVMSNSAISRSEPDIERFVRVHSRMAASSHLHYWIAWLLSGKSTSLEIAGCEEFLSSALPRFRARMALALVRPAWVRDNRAQWQRWASWDRWSLLSAAVMLPEKERRAWMDSVSKSPDIMDRLVAARVRAL